ncbi:MAG: site-2 protease family protein [Archangium sp.]|nr:site-2 protease family protein [Archangium sp.]MDP3572201.1 site-2 protease family protein [Archangium sp.]
MKRTANNSWSAVMGSVAGIQLEVHVTFVLVLAWVVLVEARQGASTRELISVLIFGLGVAASVLLHELGHALVARTFGLKTREISLTPMGGFSNIDEMPETPKVQLFVVLSGPAVSLLLSALFFGASAATVGISPMRAYDDPDASQVTQLAWFNLILGVYNLLPIFPMDGGRALRAVLAWFMPYVRATHYASRVAQLLSIVLAIAGLHYGPIFLLTAVWIWMGARREVKEVRTRFALQALKARDVMVKGPTLDAEGTLEVASRIFRSTFQSEFPVMRGTDVVGTLGFKELLAGLEKHGPQAKVETVMRNEFNGVEASQPLTAVMEQMKDSSDPMVMVTHADRYVGVLPRQNLDELVRIAHALEKNEANN